MKNLILSLFFCLASFPAGAAENVAQPENSKTTEERLRQLEEMRTQFEQWYSDFYVQGKGRVSPFLGERINLGGFFETGITHFSGDDMVSQTTANAHILGINLAADFSERLRFVSQILTGLSYTLQNPHNNPGLTPTQRQYGTPVFGTLVAQAYAELRRSDAFVIQTGLGYAPFGQAFQLREPVLFRRRGGPQMTSASDANTVGIAFPLWMGVHIEGSMPLESGSAGYNLYTFSPSTKVSKLGAGGRLWWSDSETLTAGISAQTGEQVSNSYYSYGADISGKYARFGFVSEYAKAMESGGAAAKESYYLEPFYECEDGQWTIYAAADYLNNPGRMVGAVADDFERWAFGGGVNYLPVTNVRFRLGYLNYDYIRDTDTIGGQRRDYQSVDFSTGVAF